MLEVVGVAKDNLKIQIPRSLIINKRRKQEHKTEPNTKLEPLLTGGEVLVHFSYHVCRRRLFLGGLHSAGTRGGIVFNLNTFSTERNVLKANTDSGSTLIGRGRAIRGR